MRSLTNQYAPVVDPAYWLTFGLAATLGTNLGDLAFEGLGRVAIALLLAAGAATALALGSQRLLPRKSPALYWLAVGVVPMATTGLSVLANMGFGVGRPLVLVALAAALVTALSTLRNTTDHIMAAMQLESGSGKPYIDLCYWTALSLASLLGATGDELLTYRLGLGPRVAAAAACGGLLAALALYFVAPSRRYLLYWIAIIAAYLAASTVGRLLAADRAIGVGLAGSVAIAGGLLAALLWATRRRPH